jgi:hypothetical protein
MNKPTKGRPTPLAPNVNSFDVVHFGSSTSLLAEMAYNIKVSLQKSELVSLSIE